MPWLEVIWEWDDADGNVAHIAEHGITPSEVEQVLYDPHREEESDSSGRPIWFGRTDAGRYIAVVFEWIDDVTVYPITAYDPDAS